MKDEDEASLCFYMAIRLPVGPLPVASVPSPTLHKLHALSPGALPTYDDA